MSLGITLIIIAVALVPLAVLVFSNVKSLGAETTIDQAREKASMEDESTVTMVRRETPAVETRKFVAPKKVAYRTTGGDTFVAKVLGVDSRTQEYILSRKNGAAFRRPFVETTMAG